MRAIVYSISHDNTQNGVVLKLSGRKEDGSRLSCEVTGFRPYFFVPADELSPGKMNWITDYENSTFDLKTNRRMTKVYVRNSFDVHQAKNAFSYHGESDILVSTRARADHLLTYIDIPENATRVSLSQIKILPSKPPIEPRKVYFDIEVNDEGGFAEADNPTQEITAISLYDSGTRKYGCLYNNTKEVSKEEVLSALPTKLDVDEDKVGLFHFDNEIEMLSAFGELMARIASDVSCAWNGMAYDFPYVGNRCAKLLNEDPGNEDLAFLVNNFQPYERRDKSSIALADPMAIYKKKYLKQELHGLDAVGRKLLGIGKLPRTGSVRDLQISSPATWVAYNLMDTHIMRLIDEKEKLVDYFLRIAAVANIGLEECYYNSRVVDGVLMRTARANGSMPSFCLPSKEFAPKTMREGKGARTFEPLSGEHQGVIALDLKQEYPSVIMTANISPEMLTTSEQGSVRLPTGRRYLQEPVGLIPLALRTMTALRNDVKTQAKKLSIGSPEREEAEAVSTAVKFVVNSFAGVFNSVHWRLADVEIFEDITQTSRAQLEWNRQHLEDPAWMGTVAAGLRGRVVMGDTDSCYVAVTDGGKPITDPDRLISIGTTLASRLTDSANAFFSQFGISKHYTAVDLEGVISPLFLPTRAGGLGEEAAKKRYYGLYCAIGDKKVTDMSIDSRMKIMGYEVRRFNVAPLTKEVQKTIMELVVTGKKKEVSEYVKKIREKALSGKLDNEMMVPCILGKEFDEYKAVQPFLRAIIAFKTYVSSGVKPGDEFKWVYCSVKKDGTPLAVKEFAIPFITTIEYWRSKGIDIVIDREKQYKETVLDEITKVYPDYAGKQTLLM